MANQKITNPEELRKKYLPLVIQQMQKGVSAQVLKPRLLQVGFSESGADEILNAASSQTGGGLAPSVSPASSRPAAPTAPRQPTPPVQPPRPAAPVQTPLAPAQQVPGPGPAKTEPSAPQPPQISPPAQTASGGRSPLKDRPLAPNWDRFVAFVADELLRLAIMGPVLIVYFFTLPRFLSVFLLPLGFFALAVMSILYYALMESGTDMATPGKALRGLKVTDLEGKRISFGRAFWRYTVKVFSLGLSYGLLAIVVLVTQRGLHDMLLKTVVTKRIPAGQEGFARSLKRAMEAAGSSSFFKVYALAALILLLLPAASTYALRARMGKNAPRLTMNTSLSEIQASQTPQVTKHKPLGGETVDMVLVPAGEFTMGMNKDEAMKICADDCNRLQPEDPDHCRQFNCGQYHIFTGPPHKITLDAFYIDKTAVSRGAYAECMEAKVCTLNGSYHPFPGYELTMSYVNWQEAYTYCAWANKRLPTEAEWEKAARGTDQRAHPWGNDWDPSKKYVCPEKCPLAPNGGRAPGGSFPENASPFGALDMTGNVKEWVSDWYAEIYHDPGPQSNPKGPETGTFRVFRGIGATTYLRGYEKPDARDYFGFRCAKSQ